MTISTAIAAEHVAWARAAGLTPAEAVAVISPRLRCDNWGTAQLLLEAAHEHLVVRLKQRVQSGHRQAQKDRRWRQAMAATLMRHDGATLSGRACP